MASLRQDKPLLKKSEQNPLGELSELRLNVSHDEEGLDVACRLRFSTGDVSVGGRTFSVGFTEARLQLYLEGCETAFGCDFGSTELTKVTVHQRAEKSTLRGGEVAGGFSLEEVTPPAAKGHAKREHQTSSVVTSDKTVLPMTAVPGNAWRIKNHSINPKERQVLEGSAIDGERLCRLLPIEGGNRLRVSAELQVKRANIKVEPAIGNKLGKIFSLARNRDAVVAKVLEKALRREASTVSAPQLQSTVVASRSELSEE